MPERPALSTLAGQAAPLLFTDVRVALNIMQNSLFAPLEWSKCTPYVKDHIKVSSSVPFNYGADVNFEYVKSASVLLDSALSIQLPTHTITNTLNPLNPPGQAYYVDHLGFSFINRLELQYGQNRVYDHDKYDLYFRYRERNTREIMDLENDCIFGDKTSAERTNLLLNGTPIGQPLIVPLDYCWDGNTNCCLPLICLSQRVRWVLRSEPFSNLLVRPTDGSATVTANGPTQVELLLTVGHVSGAESDHMLRLTNDVSGLTYLIHQAQRQYTEVISSLVSGERSILMTNFNRALKIVRFALLPFHLQDNTGRNDYFMFNNNPPLPLPPGPGVNPGMNPYSAIVNWRIEATGLVIQRVIENLYSRAYLRRHCFPSPHGESIFFQAYSHLPLCKNTTDGFMDYNNLPNPTLHITLGQNGTGIDPDDVTGTLPQRLLCIIHADDYNFWYFNRGNWSRAFN